MRRQAAPVALLVFHAACIAMAAMFYTKARVAVAAAFREFGTAMPPATALALSDWFLPAAVGAGIALSAAAILPLRRSQRMALLSLGLVVSGFGLVFAVAAAFVPVFRPGE